jgi:chromosome partitioning protein
MYIALGKTNLSVKPIEERFRKFIEEAKAKYDLVFIDCHPAGSIFTSTSLSNSDHVLIPVVPEKYAVRGIGLMMDFISEKSVGGAVKPHILFNRVPRTGVSAEETNIRNNNKIGKYCLGSTLKKYKVFSDPEEGSGFCWASSKPYSTEAFFNLNSVCLDVLKRIG